MINPPRCWWVWWVSCGGIGSTQKGLHKPTKSLYTGGFGGFLSGSSKKWNPSGINPPAICPISSGWQPLTGVVAKHRSGRTADVHCYWNGSQVRFENGSWGHPGTALPLNGSGQEPVAYVLGSHGFTTISENESLGPWRVRRYTPLEREHLQGFEAGWTCLCGCEPYSTEACRCPDGPRERATGDAVSVPVAEWIGRRIIAVGDSG